jgi:cyanophycinase
MTATHLRYSIVFISFMVSVDLIEAAAQTNGDQASSKQLDRRPDSRGPSKGVLYLSGGGNRSAAGIEHNLKVRSPTFVDLVRKAHSTKEPDIVVIVTAGRRDTKGKNSATLVFKEFLGDAHVTELYTRSREVANSAAFVKPIDQADGVWITGGQQGPLADTFLGTKTEKALRRVLARGGVIGGSSAGAQFQSSFMTRGMQKNGRTGPILGDKKYQRGLGFITHSAFDVHVAARNRQKNLFKLFATEPGKLQNKSLDPKQLLGIGIDELTAIIVRQDQFEVVGKGHVYVFNPREWNETTKPFFHTLSHGDQYDIRGRMVIQ